MEGKLLAVVSEAQENHACTIIQTESQWSHPPRVLPDEK